jgi:leader peptidase (prepilin peptidase)/N-methyltransferase
LEPSAAASANKPFNLSTPNSHCPSCNHAIKPWENIPVVSYLFLRGRCSACAEKISLRYPSIELLSGLLALFLGWQFGVAGPALLGALIFTWALLALTMIDIDQQLLPDDITLPLLWLGLLFNLFGTFTSLPNAVLGAMAGYLSLWSIYWLFKLATGKEGMGYGDFKLLAALGAWLGWQALPMIILLSSLVGAIIGVFLMILQRRGKDIPMPFGPYLAIAGWIAFLWGTQLLEWYWQVAGLETTP